MRNRLFLKEAAAHMKLSEETIRRGILQDIFPWGERSKVSSKWSFYIHANKFNDYGRMDVREAARLMEVAPQLIREKMKKRELPFGYAIQGDNGGWLYYICPQKFTEYTGIKIVQAS